MATPAVFAPVRLSPWDTRRISWTSHNKEAVEMFSKKQQDYINTSKQGGRAGSVWQLVENQIITCVRSTCPLSLEVITNAMTLAQRHLERACEEPEAALPPITTLSTGARRFKEIDSDKEKDASALQADIVKRQRALAVLQTKPGSGKQGGGGRGGGYAGGGRRGGRRGGCCGGSRGGAAGGCGRHPSHCPPEHAPSVACTILGTPQSTTATSAT
eukprot:2662014-Rhodomonas_salina.2